GAWAPERCTAAGVLHGGYLMSLADTAAAALAYLHLPPGATTATIEAKTNFLTAVRSGFVTARAEPVHVGRRTIVVQVDVTDDAGTRVTRTLQTHAVSAADKRVPRLVAHDHDHDHDHEHDEELEELTDEEAQAEAERLARQEKAASQNPTDGAPAPRAPT